MSFLADGPYVSLIGIGVIIKNVIFENAYELEQYKKQMLSNSVDMSVKLFKCLKITGSIAVKELEYRNV